MLPVLAAWFTRPWMVVSSELTCDKELSAVEIILLAIWLFDTACCVLVMSPARAWLAIRPAGSSVPS